MPRITADRDSGDALAGGRHVTTPRAHTLPSDPLIDEVRQRRQELLASCDKALGKSC